MVAAIERVELALKLGQVNIALRLAEQIDPGVWTDRYRRDLVELVRTMMIVRAKLAGLDKDLRCRRAGRQKVWQPMSALVAERIHLGPLLFERIERLADCPIGVMSDLELYAKAHLARVRGKLPLAESVLEKLLGYKTGDHRLRLHATNMLAECLAKTGRLDHAVAVLIDRPAEPGVPKELNCQILARAGTLAWQSYQQQSDRRHRKQFVEAATRMLAECAGDKHADRFKVLLADQLSQMGQFHQACQWLEQVEPGSDLYIESQAGRVIVMSRQFTEMTTHAAARSIGGGKLGELVGQIVQSTKQLMSTASAGQKSPGKVATWTMNDDRVKVIGNALVTCVRVLSHKAVGRREEAEKIETAYKPLIERYQRNSAPALAVRVVMLCEQFNERSLREALTVGEKLLDASELDEAEKAQTLVSVLSTVHRYVLDHQADPVVKLPGELAGRSKTLADKAVAALRSSAQLAEWSAISCADAGDYVEFKKRLAGLGDTMTLKTDLDLGSARAMLAEKNYMLAATSSIKILHALSPQDVRYWHALIINLTAHLKLGSDRDQIAAAIIPRQQEFPKLGGQATRKQLLEILQTAKQMPGSTRGSPHE